MTRSRRRLGAWRLGLLLALPYATPAHAGWEFALRVGAAVPVEEFADVAGAGAFISGTVLARTESPASLGIEIGGNVGHDKSSTETTIFQLTPVVRVEAPLAGGGLLYLLLGAGYYQIDVECGAPFCVDGRESDLGINAGVGVLIPIAAHASLGVDVRYHHLFGSGDDPQYVIPALVLAFTP